MTTPDAIARVEQLTKAPKLFFFEERELLDLCPRLARELKEARAALSVARQAITQNMIAPIYGVRGRGELSPKLGIRCECCKNESVTDEIEHDSDCWMSKALARIDEVMP